VLISLLFNLFIMCKNHDTMRESPTLGGAACAADYGFINFITTSSGTEGNCIYRPVRDCSGGIILMRVIYNCRNDYLKRANTLI